MTRPFDLNADEIRRLTGTVRRRLRDHPDVVGVGFGVAMKDDEPDPARPHVIRMWIERKRAADRISAARHIPKSVTVRLKRGDRFITLHLPIDVDETVHIEPTARIRAGDTTTSCVVRWTAANLDLPEYGFITVAHGLKFAGADQPGQSVSIDGAHGSVVASVRWLSPNNRAVDAAILRCEREDLRPWLGGELPRRQESVVSPEGFPLLAASKQSGQTRTSGGESIRYLSYTPGPIRLSARLPALRHVLEADAAIDGAFRPGTSGSMWDSPDGMTAMQSAGLAPHFRRGYAVSLRSSLAHAFAAMRATSLVVMDSRI